MVLYAPFFMNIFQIGKIGNLGTKHIIEEKYDELQKIFSKDFLNISIKKIDESLDSNHIKNIQNKIFIKENDIIYYKKISKGGFLSTLYSICEDLKKEDILKNKEDRILKSNVLGLNYFLLNTDILQSTIEISNFYDINPYRLYTDNAYIVFSNNECIEGFKYIGKTTNDKKRIRVDIDTNSFLTKDYKDEINKVLIDFKFLK